MWWTLLLAFACGGGSTSPSEPVVAPVAPAPVAVAPPSAPPSAAPTRSITALPRPDTVPLAPEGLTNGDWAPLLDLPNLTTGQPWSLADVVGPTAKGPTKAVIVSFSASWCGPCRAALPHFNQLLDEHGDALQIIIVTTDQGEAGRASELRYVQAAGLKDVPVLVPTDVDVMAWLGQRRNIPHFFILNRAGEVLVQDHGYGEKVRAVLPKQLNFAMSHPDYTPR